MSRNRAPAGSTLSARHATHPLLRGSPYVAYTYGYPHKTAYRPFAASLPLHELWAGEDRRSLSLYLHVPFCEYRCGFCNLFTRSNPAADLPRRYLTQLRIEAERTAAALGEAAFHRVAVGGGTPTFLDVPELAELLTILTGVMGARLRSVPVSCEASPATVTPDKLALLREFGVDRLSVGIQTFDDDEAGRLGRPQKCVHVERALSLIREAGFPTRNFDLIYGGEGQSIARWLDSVRRALAERPEELYLYPLYVRPLTGLGRQRRSWDDHRLDSYRAARDLLRVAGYRQVSMRLFRAPHAPNDAVVPDGGVAGAGGRFARSPGGLVASEAFAGASQSLQPRPPDLQHDSALAPAPNDDGPVYCCQTDGMVGLGCGARSYTRSVHYSGEYAVGQSGVRSILGAYLGRDAAWFDSAHYGDRLPPDDQRRRFVVLSLLQCEGLSRRDYATEFGADVLTDLPLLADLEPLGLAVVTEETMRLTEAGIERSDAIGPWLSSDRVRRLMESSPCHTA